MLLQLGMGCVEAFSCLCVGRDGVLCHPARMESVGQQSARGEVGVMTWLQARPTGAPSPQWWPSTLWSSPCCLPSLAAFLCSLLPAQPAPCPHWRPCQSSIPQAWLHLPNRD